MRDSLKEHVDSKLEAFDVYPFDTKDGWDQLAKQVVTEEKKSKEWFFGIAVSLAIVLVTTFLILSSSVSGVPTELAEIEGYYEDEINQKVLMVKRQLDDDRILKDLELMDQAFSELKADLQENVDNEEVVMAMMENYQLKLQILEEILQELEKEQREDSD